MLRAPQCILAKHPWTDPQRTWLQDIAVQIAQEMVVDGAAPDHEPFRKEGGFRRLNSVCEGQIEAVLGEWVVG